MFHVEQFYNQFYLLTIKFFIMNTTEIFKVNNGTEILSFIYKDNAEEEQNMLIELGEFKAEVEKQKISSSDFENMLNELVFIDVQEYLDELAKATGTKENSKPKIAKKSDKSNINKSELAELSALMEEMKQDLLKLKSENKELKNKKRLSLTETKEYYAKLELLKIHKQTFVRNYENIENAIEILDENIKQGIFSTNNFEIHFSNTEDANCNFMTSNSFIITEILKGVKTKAEGKMVELDNEIEMIENL